MVGGSFGVESAPGKGTTIRAQIPLSNGTGNRGIRLVQEFRLGQILWCA